MKRLGPAVVLSLLLLLLLPGSTAGNAGIDAVTNQYRAENNLPALPTWAPLTALALQRAHEIVGPASDPAANFHHPSDWGYMWDALPGCVTYMGENIRYVSEGFNDTPEWFVQRWYESAPHRQNMLGKWDSQGSALIYANGYAWGVQLFAVGCLGAAAPTPAPAPQPAPQPPNEQNPPASEPTVQTPITNLPDTAMRSPCQTSRTLSPSLNRMTAIYSLS